MLAAMEEAVIPAPVKPMAPSTTGTEPTATAVRGEVPGQGDSSGQCPPHTHTLTVGQAWGTSGGLKGVDSEPERLLGMASSRRTRGAQLRGEAEGRCGSLGTGLCLQQDLPWESPTSSGSFSALVFCKMLELGRGL